jgi:hypothetical protein
LKTKKYPADNPGYGRDLRAFTEDQLKTASGVKRFSEEMGMVLLEDIQSSRDAQPGEPTLAEIS